MYQLTCRYLLGTVECLQDAFHVKQPNMFHVKHQLKQLIKIAYASVQAEAIRLYAIQLASVGTGDAVIRDYLGAQGK